MSNIALKLGDTPPLRTERNNVVPSGVLGMLIFVAAEIMFFAALISAYMVVSAGSSNWPPLDQPRLPVFTTTFNTFALLLSGWFLFLSNRSFSTEGNSAVTKHRLNLAVMLGTFFILFQGFEWVRLIQYGLTMRSSVFGSFFYLIVGAHGAHALAALLLLFHVFRTMRNGTLRASLFWTSQVFWYFVVGVWPFLYVLVYLS